MPARRPSTFATPRPATAACTPTRPPVAALKPGHIFQLGRKYSQAMDATFTTAEGGQDAFWMGCCGIGVSLAQAAVEQHHDKAGICWPLAIAPFQVVIVVANSEDDTQLQLGEQLYSTSKPAPMCFSMTAANGPA